MQGGAIFVPQFAYRDWILPLDDYIETADEWNWEDFMPSTRDDVTIDGQVLAIPYRLDVRTLVVSRGPVGGGGLDGAAGDLGGAARDG